MSDHSPLIVKIGVQGCDSQRIWSLNPIWLEIIGNREEMKARLREFIEHNAGSASEGVVWDSLKAYLRGLLIQQISKVKKQTRVRGEAIREEVLVSERKYVADPRPENQECWVRKQQEYKMESIRVAENRKLFQRQRNFGEGESVGRMLAILASTNAPSSTVPLIKTSEGEISSDSGVIREMFF